jgi:lipopolysaccharide/colanic/teichoic acid biosynthesis glycosyltransferase
MLASSLDDRKSSEKRYASLCKRLFDCVLAACLLLVCVPLFIAFGLLVAMDGGPIFYGHRRVGRNGRLFNCYKFRTMVIGAHEVLEEYLELHPTAAAEWRRAQKLDNDPRITGIGRLLRHISLDELPQLANVLRGEMSLVGPRPVTESELVRYGAQADDYLSCTPGITGLWQTAGRNRLSYDQRVALDVDYIKKRSLWLDCIILLKTTKVLITGDGK